MPANAQISGENDGSARRTLAELARSTLSLKLKGSPLTKLLLRRVFPAGGVLAAAICFLSASSVVRAQESRPTFRSSISLVPITAVVRDAKNRIVRELGKDDFEVREDDQVRRVVDFSATSHGPISVAILFDTSGSMRGTHLERGTVIVHRLLDRMVHASDEAALFTFDKTVQQNTSFTSDFEGIRQVLNAGSGWGVTSLYDAIAETAKHVGERHTLRRAVIVVTDGVDTASTLAPSEVSARASAIDVPVFIINVAKPRRSSDGSAIDDNGLADLARWTGGDLQYVTAPEQVVPAMAALIAELRQQYFLAIESALSAGWYRLDVRTRRKGLTVRARSGYFANSATPVGAH
jgi:Ca-activated chloride channel homolog